MVNGVATPTTVNGDAWAAQLSQQLGQPVTAGEPYYFPGCTSAAQCVLPNAQLPTGSFSPISTKLLPYIRPPRPVRSVPPEPESSPPARAKSISAITNSVDASTTTPVLPACYRLLLFRQVQPHRSLLGGELPCISGLQHRWQGPDPQRQPRLYQVFRRLQRERISSRLFSTRHYTQPAAGREGNHPRQPGLRFRRQWCSRNFPVVLPASRAFRKSTSIVSSLAFPAGPNQLIDNIYQVLDNYSRAIGTHNIKFGGQFHFSQLEENCPTSPTAISSLGPLSRPAQRNRQRLCRLSPRCPCFLRTRASLILPMAAAFTWAFMGRIAGEPRPTSP